MFKIQPKPEETPREKKATYVYFLKEAFDEIKKMAVEQQTSMTTIISQMVYSCLNRDQITGLKRN